MAKPNSNDPIVPMDLANMRHNGVRSLAVQCRGCRHEVIMNVDHLPGDVTVPSLRPKMVCTNGPFPNFVGSQTGKDYLTWRFCVHSVSAIS
jgi:hypothetical protein